MFTLIPFATLILSTYGATRFVIDNYTLPDIDKVFSGGGSIATGAPYPLDVCVGYLVEFTQSFQILNYYGMYSCNDNGDMVTFTDYGQDSSCMTADGTNDKSFSYDGLLGAGEIGTFNCDGEDNYVQIGAYTQLGDKGEPGDDGGDVCCADPDNVPSGYVGITITTLATGVCTMGEIGGNVGYTSGMCDDAGSETFIYADNACTQTDGSTAETGTASATQCILFIGDTASVFRFQTNCVVNGTMENPDETPCSTTTTTAEPSLSPTTAQPTAQPTAEVTSQGYMYIINSMVLLIMGMAIFVN